MRDVVACSILKVVFPTAHATEPHTPTCMVFSIHLQLLSSLTLAIFYVQPHHTEMSRDMHSWTPYANLSSCWRLSGRCHDRPASSLVHVLVALATKTAASKLSRWRRPCCAGCLRPSRWTGWRCIKQDDEGKLWKFKTDVLRASCTDMVAAKERSG